MMRRFLAALLIVSCTLSIPHSEAQSGVEKDRMAKPAGVTVLVRYQLLPDRIEQAMQDIMKLTQTVAAKEPDCLGIEVLQDADDPTIVTLVERWTSREVYEGPHMQTKHLQSFIARARDNFAGPPDISFWLTENAE